jgi:formylglycine-generating enzyme required for sulfatase activity
MEQFLRRLEKLGLGLGDEDIADVVWLAMQIGTVTAVEIPPEPIESEQPGEVESAKPGQSITEQTPPSTAPQRQPPTVSAFASDSVSRPPDSETSSAGLPFQAPAVTALPNALDLGRALRPLMRKVPSATQFVLDSEATVNRVIEQQIWQPVLLPAPERWLDLELVIEESPLNLVWRHTLDELRRKVLERSGVFRHVRSWTLRDQDGQPQLLSRYAGEVGARAGQPQELVHPSGRGLVMVISDGQSELWQSSQLQPSANPSEPPAPNLHAWLHYWASHGPIVMVQLLPKWMWERSTLDFGTPAQLMSIFPGAANQQWSAMGLSSRQRRRMDEEPPLKLPVVTLEADALQTWATVVAAAGITPTPGFVFNLSDLKHYQQGAKETPSRLTEISDEALLDRFLATASSTAQQLAGMMAAVPVSVPVIHLLQAHFLPKSTPVHVAEVFMSGLLHQTGTHKKTHQPIYDFKTPDVRRLLTEAFPDYKTHQVVRVLSEAIANKLGRDDLNSFDAFLSLDPELLELGDDDQERIVHRFAALLPEVLRNLGGAYATLADTAELLARQPKRVETEPSGSLPEFPNIPNLEDFDYVTPVVRFEDERENALENDIGLTSEVKTVEVATIAIATSISDSISEAQAYRALEQNLADIKQQIIEDFEERELDFRVDKHPRDIGDIDENQISVSRDYETSVEVLNTELEEIEENVATFRLLAKISFTAEIDYFDHDENVPNASIEWTGQAVDGRVQVYLRFSEEDATEVEITDVELDLESPVQLRDPDRSTPVETAPAEELELFEIHIKTVEKIEGEWVALSSTSAAHSYIEPLSQGVDLEMVAIPSGEFQMGSPEDEPERYGNESPQHLVTLPSFFMGRYPVTQAQWRVVAALPREARDLEPNPSRFKGDDRPVEQVSWDDAVEFCARLSRRTGREYRLPSEAEWEYACRAGTATPFHFGEMITTEVANYNGSAYADGPEGESRGETTPVAEFGIANMFGLSDMHGNVFEWCLAHWHENYEGAPADGSAWLSDDERAYRVCRGGSWSDDPRYCRSASRYRLTPDYTSGNFGFRVVVAPRGLH